MPPNATNATQAKNEAKSKPPTGDKAQASSAAAATDKGARQDAKGAAANPSSGAVAVAPARDKGSFWSRLRRNRAIVDPSREDAVLVKLDAVEEKIGAFEKRLGSVEDRMTQSLPEYTKAVGQVEGRISDLSGSVSKGLAPLDQRLQALESSVGGWVGSLEEKLGASQESVAGRIDGLEGQLSRVMDIEDKLGGIGEVKELTKKLRSAQQALDERTRSQSVGIISVTVIALIAAAGTIVLLLEELGILEF